METEYFYVAVYLRLSREERLGYMKESNSIHSQREMIFSFVEKQSNMEVYDVYIDDGYSGMDFQRPAWKKMIEDLSDGKINCIIVKDLSRFGRDYIEVGRWIQKIFPDFGIRFIALLDRYDSKTATESETSLLLPIKNFINDSYCRDISQKVKSHQRIKREKGEFIGAFAIYGYHKSEKNPNCLVRDPYAAEIVKKIYQWRLTGISMLAIAEYLNQAGILSPMEYKRFHGENYYTGFGSKMFAKWSATAVKRILEDETYTGVLVQGKGERINYKIKKSVLKKREDWIRVSNCHEAIITEEEYNRVQELLSIPIRANKDNNKGHSFAGMLFCADCKRHLIRRKNHYRGKEKVFYICSTKNKGLGCSRHSIEESILLDCINKIVKLYSESNKYKRKEELEIQREQVHRTAEKELEKLKEYKKNYPKLYCSLREDIEKGILTEEEASSLYYSYQEQEKKIEEIIIKQQNYLEQEEDGKEYLWRKQNLSIVKRIEVEENHVINFILNNGEIVSITENAEID